MTTLQKKICMLGAAGVGKTSLVRRFVESIFSERYQATVGVKIDRRMLTLGNTTLNLMLWDLQGEAEHQATRLEYLRGAAGFLVVADASRPETLGTALELARRGESIVPDAPWLLLVNKVDLAEPPAITPAVRARGPAGDLHLLVTSARSGLGVEEAFNALAQRILAAQEPVGEAP